jgi:hypothetical protein
MGSVLTALADDRLPFGSLGKPWVNTPIMNDSADLLASQMGADFRALPPRAEMVLARARPGSGDAMPRLAVAQGRLADACATHG